MTNTILIGAGGHAKVICEILEQTKYRLIGYAALDECDWLDLKRYDDNTPIADATVEAFVMGIGGVNPYELSRRLGVYHQWQERGVAPINVSHPTAVVSKTAQLNEGVCVLAGAVLQPGASIGAATIINTRAIVEHDALVGDGVHIAPGAIVLAEAQIGASAMISAQATILPRAVVPPGTFVRAGELYPASKTTVTKDA
ncbi:MAG: hypothetical protein AAGD43_01245 [Pseudomonadota bacterium]